MKKKFDFEEALKHHAKDRVELMKKYYNKPISEDKWVELVSNLPKKKLHNSHTRGPSKIRQDYKSLKKNFGFFS